MPTPPTNLFLRRHGRAAMFNCSFMALAPLLALAAPRVFSAEPAQPPDPAAPAGHEQVRRIMETFEGRGVMRDNSRPLAPADALKSFKLRDGLAIELIAAEPAVRQPLYLSFDSRGRLWVTQYRQYPFPAGLKVVGYDQHLRAEFDRVPEPPPRGVKGADVVTVFEDRDGDGVFETHRDVITGLNLATAAIKGAGGIWVLNPPYLLFYPDANDDDIPDGEPQVCLSGFGLEDTHSVASSLAFGPDGWLYGAVGSTTTGNVSSRVTKGVAFVGQHIWRYHPRTEVFEIFAEGGGNTFSCEIDAQGRVFSGTNGSQRGMHYDQGMHGVKNFGKHGTPDNPYAFGYFDHLVTKGDTRRFSQAFCIYDGDLMARELGGRIVAPNALHNVCPVSRLVPDTSTFRAEDEAPLLTSTDRWFRPVDAKVGPDGAIYLADWYDTRLSHVSPVDDWSKQDGRIYRVLPAGASLAHAPFDLHTAPAAALVNFLSHPNKWFRRQAVLELHWRGLRETIPALTALALDGAAPPAFDAVCALELLGGLDDALAAKLLRHADPYVRRWVVRCVGDRRAAAPALVAALVELAQREPHPEVRTQLLASARRLPAAPALAVARTMMARDDDARDLRIPLMLWWTLETHSETARAALLALFRERELWSHPLARTHGARLLAQRWALAGGPENFDACAQLLALAPAAADRALVIAGLAEAFAGAKIPALPPALATALDAYLATKLDTDLALAVKTGQAGAVKKALVIVADDRAAAANRIALVQALTEAREREVVPAILKIFSRSGAAAGVVRQGILPFAAQFDEPALATAVVRDYETRFSQTPALRDAAHRLLASRAEWARLLLAAVERREIRAADVAPDVVRQLGLHGDAAIDAQVRKLWRAANVRLTDGEKLAELRRMKGVLTTSAGEVARGRGHFAQRCAACHTLFGQGGQIGPDLTGYDRASLDFWLVAILDPSAEIREGYGAYTVRLKDGRALMGLLAKQDAAGVVLRDMSGQTHAVAADEIEKLEALPKSLMPEGLLGGLDDAALRDLFAYLTKP